jgi:hypothetical protein
MILSSFARFLFIVLLVFASFRFVRRLISWRRRLERVRKTMPAIPVLFPPASIFRNLWPKKWQTYHYDWHTQYRRTMYHNLGSDVFTLVSLFEYDKTFVCNPNAVIEMKITQAENYPKDKRQLASVCLGGLI